MKLKTKVTVFSAVLILGTLISIRVFNLYDAISPNSPDKPKDTQADTNENSREGDLTEKEKLIQAEERIIQKQLSNGETKIEFEGNTATINPNDKNCISDSDCTFVQPDCGDCTFETVNKESLLKYNVAKTEYCSINKPEIMCDSMFDGKLKCRDSKCMISEIVFTPN